MKKYLIMLICVAGTFQNMSDQIFAQQVGTSSILQNALLSSAKEEKFTLIVFYKDQNESTRLMQQKANEAVSINSVKLTTVSAYVDSVSEKVMVDKFGISRAPMPMMVIVAPNGAVTGLYPRTVSDEQISSAIVTSTMMSCMKELQDKKLVFVCLSRTEQVEIPQGVLALQQDPNFKDRVSLIPMRVEDPSEYRLYQQMKLDPTKVQGPYAVMIAPPGVLVGHFDQSATADQIAAAIHKSGKCCDDVNCKHNHAPQANSPTSKIRK